MGREIVLEFARAGVPFVVVDADLKVLALEGDASSEEVLERAGLHRARGLIAALGSEEQISRLVALARGGRAG